MKKKKHTYIHTKHNKYLLTYYEINIYFFTFVFYVIQYVVVFFIVVVVVGEVLVHRSIFF